MRVLHVINSLSGSGGAEQGLVREVTRLNDIGDQLVVRLYEPDVLSGQVEAAGLRELGLGLDSSRSGWNWVWGVRLLRKVIDDFEPDIVHSSLFSANLIAQLATRGRSIPVLSTMTNSGDPRLVRAYQPGQDRFRASALRGVAGFAARQDHVWFRALTADALQTSCDALGVEPSRAVVIPRGVPLPDLTLPSPSKAALGLPSDVAIVLNVGRQAAQKGQVQLIEAFHRLLGVMPAHLVILGREGDATSDVKKAIETANIEDSVTIVPFTDRVYDYYRAADVFAFSSLMEGLGTAVLEAMSAQLPVVAYDIPPVREATADGSFATLVPVGDVNALTEAVRMALSEAGSAAVSAKEGRAWVEANFTLDRVAAQLGERLTSLRSLSATTPAVPVQDR